MIEKEYMTVKEANLYCGIGIRALREHLKNRDPPLPHYRVNRKLVLIKKSELNEWMSHFKVESDREASHLDKVVDEIVSAVSK